MRTLSIAAAAAIGLAASAGIANAQATNFAPVSGTARAYYGNGSDVPGRWSRDYRTRDYWDSRAMARSPRLRAAPGYYYAPGYRTEGIPPALYHAGDPQYWR